MLPLKTLTVFSGSFIWYSNSLFIKALLFRSTVRYTWQYPTTDRAEVLYLCYKGSFGVYEIKASNKSLQTPNL